MTWETLTIAPTPYEAELILGLLRNSDIHTETDSRYFSQDPVTTGALGQIHVKVPAEYLEQARAVLSEQLSDAAAAQPSDEASAAPVEPE